MVILPTYPVTSNDEKLVLVIEGSLGRIRRSDNKLLHRGVTQRSCDGEDTYLSAQKKLLQICQLTVDPIVHDESSSVRDTLRLLMIATFVIISQSDGLSTSAILSAKRNNTARRTDQRTARASPTLAV